MADDDRDYEKEAGAIGWVPEADFRGEKSRWVSAEEFVKRGETVLPILRSQNQGLHTTVKALNTELAALKGELAAVGAGLKAVEESHEADVQERVKSARAELKRQLIDAKTNEDHAREVEILEQIEDLRDAQRDAKATPKVEERPAPRQEPVSPETTVWTAKNKDWLESDREKRAIAFALGDVIRQDGFSGKAFFEELDRRLAAHYKTDSRPRTDSRVEGGSNGGGEAPSGSGKGKSFADLPADAQAACNKLANKMVGPNRAHKDAAAWRASYAKQYLELTGGV